MRINMRLALGVGVVTILSVPAAWGQAVLSAKSGTIQHVEGEASISGFDLKPNKVGEFPALEQGNTLITKAAHAEVLLTPGAFLRVGEDTQLEMVSNKLTDTRVKLLEGSALVEVGEIYLGNQITVQVGDYKVSLAKAGLYRFDASPERIRVFEGKADVASASEAFKTIELHAGRELTLASATPAKFDRKKVDELYAWSSGRAALVARANITAARSAANSNSFTKSTGSQWIYQPYFGLYTYLPGSGIWASPFGYSYYSPRQVWVISPTVSNAAYSSAANSGMGARAGSSSSAANSGGMSSTGGSFGGAASAGAPSRGGGGGGMAGGRGR